MRATHNAEFIIGWQTDLFFCFVTSKQSDSWVVEPFCILTDLQVKRHPRIFSVFLIVNPSYFLLLGNAVRRAPPPLGIPANSIPVDSLDIARARLQFDKSEVIISSVFSSVFHYWFSIAAKLYKEQVIQTSSSEFPKYFSLGAIQKNMWYFERQHRARVTSPILHFASCLHDI